MIIMPLSDHQPGIAPQQAEIFRSVFKRVAAGTSAVIIVRSVHTRCVCRPMSFLYGPDH